MQPNFKFPTLKKENSLEVDERDKTSENLIIEGVLWLMRCYSLTHMSMNFNC